MSVSMNLYRAPCGCVCWKDEDNNMKVLADCGWAEPSSYTECMIEGEWKKLTEDQEAHYYDKIKKWAEDAKQFHVLRRALQDFISEKEKEING